MLVELVVLSIHLVRLVVMSSKRYWETEKIVRKKEKEEDAKRKKKEQEAKEARIVPMYNIKLSCVFEFDKGMEK